MLFALVLFPGQYPSPSPPIRVVNDRFYVEWVDKWGVVRWLVL